MDSNQGSVTVEEWNRRKEFVGFGKNEELILRELHLVARTYADEVMDELYRRWLQLPVLRAFFADDKTLTRVKSLQRQYFISLTEGEYGAPYLVNRLRIGEVHQRIGLSPRWYMGAYAIYLELVLPKVLSAFEYNRDKQALAVTALSKLIALDQELALTAYLGRTETETRSEASPRTSAS